MNVLFSRALMQSTNWTSSISVQSESNQSFIVKLYRAEAEGAAVAATECAASQLKFRAMHRTHRPTNQLEFQSSYDINNNLQPSCAVCNVSGFV